MWYNLIFGLILIMFVPGSEGELDLYEYNNHEYMKHVGFNWIGTFNSDGSCNTSKCCCPSALLTNKDTTSKIVGFISITGTDCPTEKNITIAEPNKDSLDDKSFGLFKITSNNRIEATIYQVLIS